MEFEQPLALYLPSGSATDLPRQNEQFAESKHSKLEVQRMWMLQLDLDAARVAFHRIW